MSIIALLELFNPWWRAPKLLVKLKMSLSGSNSGIVWSSRHAHISLKYWPLEVMRSSLLASEPSSTYTLIGPWCRSTLKMLLMMLLELLFLESYVMSRGLWRTLSFLPSCFHHAHYSMYYQHGRHVEGSPLLNHIQAHGKVTP
jgi:hypothetical protein